MRRAERLYKRRRNSQGSVIGTVENGNIVVQNPATCRQPPTRLYPYAYPAVDPPRIVNEADHQSQISILAQMRP